MIASRSTVFLPDMVVWLKELHSMRPDDNEVLSALNLLNADYPKIADAAGLLSAEEERHAALSAKRAKLGAKLEVGNDAVADVSASEAGSTAGSCNAAGSVAEGSAQPTQPKQPKLKPNTS